MWCVNTIAWEAKDLKKVAESAVAVLNAKVWV